MAESRKKGGVTSLLSLRMGLLIQMQELAEQGRQGGGGAQNDDLHDGYLPFCVLYVEESRVLSVYADLPFGAK